MRSLASHPEPIDTAASPQLRKVAMLEACVGRRDTLRRALAALGWREGINLDLQFVSAIGQEEHAAALAAAMVAGKPDVIATSSAITTRVLQQATRSIPIVMVFVVDPGRQRLCRQPGPTGRQHHRPEQPAGRRAADDGRTAGRATDAHRTGDQHADGEGAGVENSVRAVDQCGAGD